jgi:HEAT repeat protein
MVNLAQLSKQLESPQLKDRLLALVALRDVAPAEAFPLLKKALADESLQIRSMAVFGLGVKPTPECLPLLVNLLQSDPDYGIRADAAGALGYLQDERAVEPLIHALYEDTEWLVRFSAAVSLGNLGDARAYDVLMQALDAPEPVVQQAVIAALGEIGAVAAVDRLLTFVQSEDWLVRQRLAEALGNLPGPKTRAALQYLAKDNYPQVRAAAAHSLSRLGDKNHS